MSAVTAASIRTLVTVVLTRPDGETVTLDRSHLAGASFSTSAGKGFDGATLKFWPRTVPVAWYRPNTTVQIAVDRRRVWEGYLTPPKDVGGWMADVSCIGTGLVLLDRLEFDTSDTTEMETGACLRTVLRAAAPGITIDDTNYDPPQGTHRPIDWIGQKPGAIVNQVVAEGSADGTLLDWAVWESGKLALTRRQPPAIDDAHYWIAQDDPLLTRQPDESGVRSTIRIAYTVNGFERLTPWEQNEATAAKYGIRQETIRAGEMTAAAALQYQDTLLKWLSRPTEAVSIRRSDGYGLLTTGGVAVPFYVPRAGQWVYVQGDAEPRMIVSTVTDLFAGTLEVACDAEPRTLAGLLGTIQQRVNGIGAGVNPTTGVRDPRTTATVNVRDVRFAGGAKGDGVTDDTLAFLLAAEAANGGKVLVPRGEYTIRWGSTADLDSVFRLFSNTTFEGEGPGLTIIRAHPDSFDTTVYTSAARRGMRGMFVEAGCIVRGITFDGNKSAAPVGVVRMSTYGVATAETAGGDPAVGVLFENCHFINCLTRGTAANITSSSSATDAFTHDSATALTVGTEVIIAGHDGQWNPDGSGDIPIAGNFVVDTVPSSSTFTLDGVDITVSGTTTGTVTIVSDKTLEGAGLALTDDSARCEVRHCQFYDNDGSGLSIIGPSDGGHRVWDVRSYDNGWQGIVCYKAQLVTVDGFEVYGNGRMGYTAEHSQDIVYRNGYTHDNDRRGAQTLGYCQRITWDTIRFEDNGSEDYNGSEMAFVYASDNEASPTRGIVTGFRGRNLDIISVLSDRREVYIKLSSNTNIGTSLPSGTIEADGVRLWEYRVQINESGTLTTYNTTNVQQYHAFTFPAEPRVRLVSVGALTGWTASSGSISAAASTAFDGTGYKVTATATSQVLKTSVPATGNYLVRLSWMVEDAADLWEVRVLPAGGGTPVMRKEIITRSVDENVVMTADLPYTPTDRTASLELRIENTSASVGTDDVIHVMVDVLEVESLGVS